MAGAGCRGGRDRDLGRVAGVARPRPFGAGPGRRGRRCRAGGGGAAPPGLGRARAARRPASWSLRAGPAARWCCCRGAVARARCCRAARRRGRCRRPPRRSASLSLAGAWPAIAARAASPWRRAVLGITGWVWLGVASALADADLYARRPAATPSRVGLDAVAAAGRRSRPGAACEHRIRTLRPGLGGRRRGASAAGGAAPIPGGARAGHGLVGDGCVCDRYIPRCQPLSRRWNACHRGARCNRRRDRRACAGGPQKLA